MCSLIVRLRLTFYTTIIIFFKRFLVEISVVFTIINYKSCLGMQAWKPPTLCNQEIYYTGLQNGKDVWKRVRLSMDQLIRGYSLSTRVEATCLLTYWDSWHEKERDSLCLDRVVNHMPKSIYRWHALLCHGSAPIKRPGMCHMGI